MLMILIYMIHHIIISMIHHAYDINIYDSSYINKHDSSFLLLRTVLFCVKYRTDHKSRVIMSHV